MTVNDKIKMLRESMKKHGVNALVIPSSDPHMSEYLPEHWKQRMNFSGFTGSAGTLVVTEDESGLWTDGRYFVQAAKQLEGSEIKLFKMAVKGFPTIPEYLADKLPNKVLGIDGSVTSLQLYKTYEKALSKVNATIRSVPCISECWKDRPAIPETEVYIHDIKFTGLSAAEKISALREKLAEKGAEGMVVSNLTEVIWLLNVRADDVLLNPYVVSFAYVGKSETVWFVNQKRVPAAVVENLKANNVKIMDYDDIIPYINKIKETQKVLVDDSVISFDIYNAVKNNPNLTVVEDIDPIILMKGVKNPTEIENIKYSQVKDGCALVRFQMLLEEKMAKGEKITELDVSDMVLAERAKEKDFVSASFDTIAAYGANAAMMHYKPTEENNTTVQNHGFLLVDNGGHYLDGTTDTTRTYAMGALTDLEKEYYTLVLKSMISMANVVFLEGGTGGSLDIMARNVLWKRGLDYRCGTGHGVGFFGGIHEGPQSLRFGNTVKFVPGMTITDEPGIYEEDLVGIRIENDLLCVEYKETEYGKFLAFEPITYCPIDLTPVIGSMMNNDEIEWLDNYHALTYEKLAPHLTDAQKEWLKKKTAPFTEQVK